MPGQSRARIADNQSSSHAARITTAAESTREPDKFTIALDRNVLDGTAAASPGQAIALQRAVGNHATARLLGGPVRPLQRHPEGAPVLGGLGTVGGATTAMPAPNAVGEGTDAGTTAPATPAPGPAGPDGGTPGPTAPVPDAGSPGPATPGTDAGTPATTPATTGPTPPTLTMPTLQTAYAQNALQTSFGGIAPKPIITGNITVVADQAALYKKYDEWMINHNMTNKATGAKWALGDKQKEDTAGGFRMNAFAEPAPSTDIYIDATQTDPTATVHEMLHVNTAAGFIAAVGRAINEGITQKLAKKAVSDSGNSLAGSESTYVPEQEVVAALSTVVGESLVDSAYFNGAAPLISTYETLMGKDTWALLKSTLSTDDAAGYAAAKAMLVPPSVTQKIAAINAILDGWFISSNDLDMIERVVATTSPTEKAEIYKAIEPRVKELWFQEKRERLKAILGTGGVPAGPDIVDDGTMMA